MPSFGTARFSGAVTIGAASAVVRPADPSRRMIILSNAHATQVLWLQLTTDSNAAAPKAAVVGEGIRLSPGDPALVLEEYQGPVTAIATGAGTGCGVAEI